MALLDYNDEFDPEEFFYLNRQSNGENYVDNVFMNQSGSSFNKMYEAYKEDPKNYKHHMKNIYCEKDLLINEIWKIYKLWKTIFVG